MPTSPRRLRLHHPSLVRLPCRFCIIHPRWRTNNGRPSKGRLPGRIIGLHPMAGRAAGGRRGRLPCKWQLMAAVKSATPHPALPWGFAACAALEHGAFLWPPGWMRVRSKSKPHTKVRPRSRPALYFLPANQQKHSQPGAPRPSQARDGFSRFRRERWLD